VVILQQDNILQIYCYVALPSVD